MYREAASLMIPLLKMNSRLSASMPPPTEGNNDGGGGGGGGFMHPFISSAPETPVRIIANNNNQPE